MSLITDQPHQRGIFSQVRRIIIVLLHDPSMRSSSRVARLISWPLVVTLQFLGFEDKTRVRFKWSIPNVDEVVDRYQRGFVLFGHPGGHLTKFEWQSFAARAIATKETGKVSSRLRRLLRNNGMEMRVDVDFLDIARACQEGRSGWTWLTDDLIDVYRQLDNRGLMAAIGTYRDGRLIGGLFGTVINRTFCIMSIFHRENHAGSLAMAAAIDVVMADGRWTMVDFGNIKPHSERFGAVEVSEGRFLELLRENSRTTLNQTIARN